MILPKTRDGGWGYRFNPYKYGSHTMEKWIMKEKLRLCLVAVKCFPENTYFLEMLISGKGKYFHVFGCISKNFPENIFWCLEKKKENTNKKTQATTQKKKIINDENGSSPTTAPARWRSEIAFSPSSRDRDCDLAVGLELELAISDWIFSSRARARSLSLSLSFSGNALKGK